MNYRKLGRTGLECSEVGLGTWAFASNAYGDVEERSARETVQASLEAGINLFDTAPLYGTDREDGVAETILGRALGTERDRVIIATKFGRNPTSGCVPQFNGLRAKDSVDESLRRLGTDRIDLLFFHSPFAPAEIEDDVWEALNQIKEQGKVRFIGHSISMFQQTENMARDWAAQRKIDVVQVVYSLMNREAEGLISDLARSGIGVVAREALGNGFLSGKVSRETVFPENNLNARYSREEIAERVDYVESLRFLVREPVKSMPQAALRWVLDNRGVSLVLTGARTPGEVSDCCEASAAPSFTPAEHARARALHTRDFSAA